MQEAAEARYRAEGTLRLPQEPGQIRSEWAQLPHIVPPELRALCNGRKRGHREAKREEA